MDEEKKQEHKDKHVQWDEEKLKQTQQYRGTFQKINQPKTPYHGNSSQEEEESMEVQPKNEDEKAVQQSLRLANKNKQANRKQKVDLQALNAKLKAQIAQYKKQEGEDGGMQQEQVETEEQIKKKQEFKKKRAAHYNQFKRIQQARLQMPSSDEEN